MQLLPKTVREIVMVCVVQHRCQRGVGGRTEREDEVVPCAFFENGEEDYGHDKKPALSGKNQRYYLKGWWFNGTGAAALQDLSSQQGEFFSVKFSAKINLYKNFHPCFEMISLQVLTRKK